MEGCSITGEFIKRAPLSTSLSGPEHVCQGFPATLIHDETEADSYFWNFSGGQGTWYPGNTPNLNLTFNDADTYEVFGTMSSGGSHELSLKYMWDIARKQTQHKSPPCVQY
jgi:hypothetical protein